MIPPRPPQPRIPPTPITLTKILLTEGDTPTHFCEAMLRHLNLNDAIEVRNFGGVGDLRAVLVALAATAEFKSLVCALGVIRDAEDDAAAARNAVAGAITAAGLPPHVATSIFILPDNASSGMIETLCMDAVRSYPPLAAEMACLDEFFKCIEIAGVLLPAPLRRVKNHAQAFLATRPEAQMFPGLSAYRGYWPWDSQRFDALKAFLRSL